MKVLILSANTGGGHNSVAMALKGRFEEIGDECVIEDCLSFVSPSVSRLVSTGHNALYKYLKPINSLGWKICIGNRASINENNPMYKLMILGCNKLAIYLLQNRFDVVVCTHIFAGWLVSETVKKNNIAVRTGIVETDYMPSLGCEYMDVDYHFVPTAEIAEAGIAFGIPREKVIVSGIPVKKEIYEKISKEEAKQRLNILKDRKHVIVMLGSMGGGPMTGITHYLIKTFGNQVYITVICGSNKQVYMELKLAYGKMNNVRITRFIKGISVWMDSADILVSKPGGISTTEAATKGLPMVLINCIGGCENGNRDYFVSKGGAVNAEGPKEVAEACRKLLDDDSLREEMKTALQGIAEQNDTGIIVRTFHDQEF